MAVLGFLFGRVGRKSFKRKDSDAGEAGRALEQLRSSMYNELRTSEGAKRQQLRFCGPIMAMTFNFVVAVSIILANKLVMGKVGFNFPIFLTLIHYGFAWFLMAIFKAFSLLPVSLPSKTMPFSSLFCLGAVMSLSTGLANISLKHNSVGFYQMAKISVTPTIVLAEFVLFKKKVSIQKGKKLVKSNSLFPCGGGASEFGVVTSWMDLIPTTYTLLIMKENALALAVVSVGVAVASVTDIQFNLFGSFIAITWIVPSAINKILWSNLQQKSNWTALALMWKTTPVTILFLLVLMPWLDPPGVLSFKWDFNNSATILISAALGFLLQLSGALALGATSATSHVVLGQFKTCVIMLGGYVIFHSDPGVVSLCGALAALCGMSVYTSLNLRESKDNTNTKLISSNCKEKTGVDDADIAEIKHSEEVV